MHLRRHKHSFPPPSVFWELESPTGCSQNPQPSDPPSSQAAAPSFLLVLACFTALVWLDSAAFFIIQHTPALKKDTWEGTIHLWVNGGLHFAAALVSAWLLRRRGLEVTLAAAFGCSSRCLFVAVRSRSCGSRIWLLSPGCLPVFRGPGRVSIFPGTRGYGSGAGSQGRFDLRGCRLGRISPWASGWDETLDISRLPSYWQPPRYSCHRGSGDSSNTVNESRW